METAIPMEKGVVVVVVEEEVEVRPPPPYRVGGQKEDSWYGFLVRSSTRWG